MTDKIFINAVKTLIANYFNNNVDVTDGKKITTDDVYIVWSCKTLQNFKALASTTVSDGMYYEITYNGDKNEMYFDAYKKWKNMTLAGVLSLLTSIAGLPEVNNEKEW